MELEVKLQAAIHGIKIPESEVEKDSKEPVVLSAEQEEAVSKSLKAAQERLLEKARKRGG